MFDDLMRHARRLTSARTGSIARNRRANRSPISTNLERLEERELLSGASCLDAGTDNTVAADVSSPHAKSVRAAAPLPNIAGTWDVTATSAPGAPVTINVTGTLVVTQVQGSKTASATFTPTNPSGTQTNWTGKVKSKLTNAVLTQSVSGKANFNINGLGTFNNVKYSFALTSNATVFDGTISVQGETVNVHGMKQP